MIRMIRGIVSSATAVAGKLLRLSAVVAVDESVDDRECVGIYGVQSCPPQGSECVILRQGGSHLVISTEDRRYRIALDNGEVAIATDEGDHIHFKRGGTLEIQASTKVTINGHLEVT